jgi:hypothetical protein
MKLLPRAAQQTGVRRALHQHVLEAIDSIRWRFYDSTRVGVHIEESRIADSTIRQSDGRFTGALLLASSNLGSRA